MQHAPMAAQRRVRRRRRIIRKSEADGVSSVMAELLKGFREILRAAALATLKLLSEAGIVSSIHTYARELQCQIPDSD